MTLSKAVDRAIREENARFMADRAAQEEARAYGDLCRRVYEAQELGFVQHRDAAGRATETLEAFCARAGT